MVFRSLGALLSPTGLSSASRLQRPCGVRFEGPPPKRAEKIPTDSILNSGDHRASLNDSHGLVIAGGVRVRKRRATKRMRLHTAHGGRSANELRPERSGLSGG